MDTWIYWLIYNNVSIIVSFRLLLVCLVLNFSLAFILAFYVPFCYFIGSLA